MKYIQVGSYNKLKPDPISKDSRGTLIKVGERVAYNYSGAVAIGVIMSFKNDEWKNTKYGWRCAFSLEIQHEDGFTSVVKNPNSFVIL